MKIGIAYTSVVLIWSTTPLGIYWSSESFSFIAALSLRVVIAGVLSLAILSAFRMPLIKSRSDWIVFAASALGLFPSMFLVYWSAKHIPTGLISILLTFYPFAVGLFSHLILKQNILNVEKIIALAVACVGLVFINIDQLNLSHEAALGVGAVVVAAVVWAYSTVVVKQRACDMNSFRLGTGALVVAMPVFIVLWLVLDAHIPENISHASIAGVAYLVVAGSLLGHTLFYYVLKNTSVAGIALIPLITPLLSLMLGYLFAGEVVTQNSLIGGFLILLSLMIYQGVGFYLLDKVGILYRVVFTS